MPVLYKRRDLSNTATTSPPLSPLTGGEVGKRDRVLSAFGQCDRLLGNGRRVLGRVGLSSSCSKKFQVGSVNPSSGATQVYPTKTQERVALRVEYLPTPGCFPMLSALVCPSGMTGKLGGAAWSADTVMGKIKVTVTFIGTGSETKSWLIPLPTSGETWGGEKTTAGASVAALRRVEWPLMAPDNVKDTATLRLWSECSSTEITVAFIGGVRCVDCVLIEKSYAYAREVLTDTLYASALVTDPSGQVVGTYPTEYPIEARSAADETFGSDMLLDLVDRQHHRLGPILAQWSAWDEATQPVNASDAAGVSTTSTTLVGLIHSSLTDWQEGHPGWSLSSGGTAQTFRSSNGLRETRDANACVEVRCHVYCSRSGAGNATVRLQSEAYSIAEFTVATSTPSWHTVTGFLRCGVGAEDSSVLTLLGKVAGAGSTLTVRHLLVEAVPLSNP